MDNSTSSPKVGAELATLLNYSLPHNTTISHSHHIQNYTGHAPSVAQNAATVNLGYIFLATTVPMILVRFLYRSLSHTKHKIDDYIMLLSLLLLGSMAAFNPLIISRRNNVDIGYNAKLNSQELEDVVTGSKLILASRTIAVTYTWLMKGCLLFYFERMTTYTKERWMIRGSGFILFVTWFIGILSTWTECHPINLFWDVFDEPPECAKHVTAVMVLSAVNIATTLMLMALPIPIIKRYHFDTAMLLSVGAGYLIATFMLIIPMVQLVTIANQSPLRNLLWKQLNGFAANILANSPILLKLHAHAWGHIRQFKFGRDGCTQPKLRIVPTFIEDQPFIEDKENGKEEMTKSEVGTKRLMHLLAIVAQLLKLKRRRENERVGVEFQDSEKVSSPESPHGPRVMNRRYTADLEIGASIAFLQESHPGQMDPMENTAGPTGMEDIFMGGGHGQGPIGYVSTDITSQTSQSTFGSRLRPVHSWHVRDKLRRVLVKSKGDMDGVARTNTA